MAQTGYTPLFIYSSTTAAAAPSTGNLTNGTLGSELAVNITDGKLFYKDNANAIQVLAWKITPTTAGGTGLTSYTAGDLVYYSTGTTLSKLGIGTAYYQLGVNAGATAPVYQPSATSVLTTQGDLLYASAANTLARLPKDATATRYLSNTGTTNNPAWAQINLANGVTGTLPTTNGGTGLTSFTANGVVYASSTSALTTGTGLLFDSGLNLGLGVTPSAWISYQKSFDVNAYGSLSARADYVSVTSNAYLNSGANWVYKNTAAASEYAQSGGSHFWRTAASGTAGNTFTFTTSVTLDTSSNLTLNVGNLVQGTAAKGVNFTANTPQAGKTSQLLNWYEEGTWTPAVTPQAGAITTYASGGTYTRVGRQVTVTAYVDLTNVGTASGYLQISNFPFKNGGASGAGYLQQTGTVRETGVTGVIYVVLLAGNSTNGYITSFTNGPIVWSNSYQYALTITYYTA